ncbi:MAG: chromosome segregation protein ScpA, partial [Oscillospiraceae bacterium]|nr:chromosome segregation protein ScpA [Oscillospiraceae bacterium]
FGITRFRALFKGNRSRSEVVATFLAVLELCKAHRVRLAGTEEDCTITCTQDESDNPLEFTVDSY